MYNLFKRYSIDIPAEEQLGIEMLRVTHERLLKRARQVTHELVHVQQSFLDRLLSDVEQFKNDVANFVDDYERNGPMIEGLPAQEASDRLTRFESQFNDLWKRYETLMAGEKLFGLERTDYPHLQAIKKQLNYLKRLYGLYTNVLHTMDVYYETPWKDVRIDQITNEIQEFQSAENLTTNSLAETRLANLAKMKKLPKGLKTWPAYSDLKRTLDNFNECLPLLELLINPAMQVIPSDGIECRKNLSSVVSPLGAHREARSTVHPTHGSVPVRSETRDERSIGQVSRGHRRHLDHRAEGT